MDIANFHCNLLGLDPKLTPESYRLTARQRMLYTNFERGARGYASGDLNEGDFLGAFVVAIYQTNGSSGVRPVTLVVPTYRQKWVLVQVKNVARHVFRSRRGKRAEALHLREAFQSLVLSDAVPFEPKHWATFGYEQSEHLPQWLQDGLLESPQIETPSCDPLVAALG